MKAIALANRLCRDLDAKSVIDLTADARMELLDAINGALQTLSTFAPAHSKTVPVSIPVPAPRSVTIGVTEGSIEFTILMVEEDDLYRTIRIVGDTIDNQISGATRLLHPYGGPTGTASATIYGDATALPEPYMELVGQPEILETGDFLVPFKPTFCRSVQRGVHRPLTFWVEENARNQNPSAPAVIRFDPLPDKLYRLQAMATSAPARVTFTDLLSAGTSIPLRAEHVEAYLIPIARATLTHSDRWKNKDDITATRDEAKAAKAEYAMMMPQTLATPNNRVRTRAGF